MVIRKELNKYPKTMKKFIDFYSTNKSILNKEPINDFLNRDFVLQFSMFQAWLIADYGIVIRSGGEGYFISYTAKTTKYPIKPIGEHGGNQIIEVDPDSKGVFGSNRKGFIYILNELEKLNEPF